MFSSLRRYTVAPRTIYDAQRLANIVFQMAALTSPLSEQHRYHEPWPHIVGRALLIAVSWCGCLASLVITLERDKSFISFFFESDVSKVTSVIELVLAMVAITAVYAMFFVRRERLRRLFSLLLELDARLADAMWSVRVEEGAQMSDLYRRTVLFSVCCVCINATLLTLYIVGSSVAQRATLQQLEHFYAWVAYFWPQMVLTMVVVHSMGVLWQLAQRFGQLNRVWKSRLQFNEVLAG